MKSNMGSFDRIARVVIAAVIALLYVLQVINGITAAVLLILAGVFLLTSFISVCPLYLPFGINTNKKKR